MLELLFKYQDLFTWQINDQQHHRISLQTNVLTHELAENFWQIFCHLTFLVFIAQHKKYLP